jgi:cytoskeletal protein CcmA (bactofilin family)
MRKRWIKAILVAALFLVLAAPVWADDGAGQLVLPGGSLTIGSGEEVIHDVVVVAGTLDLTHGGKVRGDVVVLAGEATVNGEIDGNLVVVAGSLSLRSGAVVTGDLVAAASSVERDPASRVEGQVQDAFHWETPIVPGSWSVFRRSQDGGMLTLLGNVLQWIMTNVALIVLGILMILFLPKPTAGVQEAVLKGWVPSAGVGLLTLMALAIVLPVLVIICLGIPIAVVLGVTAAAAGLFGWVATSIIIGHRILAGLKVHDAHFGLAVMAGVLTVRLVSAIPCIGWLAALAVLCVGLGSVVLTRFGTMPYVPVSSLAAGPPGPPEPPPDSPIS